jgi:uncharacterized protein (DUF952 family)
MTDTRFIFKIATRANFETARSAEAYLGMPIDDADGFLHFSTASQLRETLSKHFAGQGDLVLLEVDAQAIGTPLRWEPSRGGDLFPHLYAPLPLVAITRQASIAVDADGSVNLPAWAKP